MYLTSISLTSPMLWVKNAHAGLSAFPAAYIRSRPKTYKTEKSTAPSSSAPEIANHFLGNTPVDTQAHTWFTTGVRLAAQIHRPRKHRKTWKSTYTWTKSAHTPQAVGFTHVGVSSLWSVCGYTRVRVISERGRESKCVINSGNIFTMLNL